MNEKSLSVSISPVLYSEEYIWHIFHWEPTGLCWLPHINTFKNVSQCGL